MAVEILVPQLGESVYEGAIGRWLVKEGEYIKLDEPLVEIETDKITMEIPSPGEGIVVKQLVGPGEKVEVGQLIGYIAKEGEEIEQLGLAGAERKMKLEAKAEKAEAVVRLEVPEREARVEPSIPAGAEAPLAEGKETIRLSPVVANLIAQYGLDPSKIKGTGIGGRIRKIDVEAIIADPAKLAMARRGAVEVSPPLEVKPEVKEAARIVSLPPIVLGEAKEEVERQPLTTIRKSIIANLTKAYSKAVHTLSVDEADCTKMMEFLARYREEVLEKYGVKLTVTAFFVKAVIQPLKDFPLVNAELDEEKEEIVLKKYYHIGFATDTPAGLVVPKIEHADRKSLLQISVELAEKAERARQRKLELSEVHGSTFTITNAGGFGAVVSAPIINYPNTAILGVHAIQKRPVVRNGQILARDMCYLSLSFDHRVIDGVYAVKFLRAVCEQVENPERMLLF